jgi:hypothetical protein
MSEAQYEGLVLELKEVNKALTQTKALYEQERAEKD